MGRAHSTNGDNRNAYRILVAKPEGRRRHRWVDNIEMDITEIGWGGMDWIEGSCEHGNEPSGSIKCWEILE
jgi:hypothetical protein